MGMVKKGQILRSALGLISNAVANRSATQCYTLQTVNTIHYGKYVYIFNRFNMKSKLRRSKIYNDDDIRRKTNK